MKLQLNPLKAMLFASPIWMLEAMSLLLNYRAWLAQPWDLVLVTGTPLAFAVGAVLLRGRWYLELTPDALIQHTLSGPQVFEWDRMGPVTTAGGPLQYVRVTPASFHFAYPVDQAADLSELAGRHLGRKILNMFGGRSARDTAALIESWRVGPGRADHVAAPIVQ